MAGCSVEENCKRYGSCEIGVACRDRHLSILRCSVKLLTETCKEHVKVKRQRLDRIHQLVIEVGTLRKANAEKDRVLAGIVEQAALSVGLNLESKQN